MSHIMKRGDKLVLNQFAIPEEDGSAEYVVVDPDPRFSRYVAFVNERFLLVFMRQNYLDDLVGSGRYSHVPACELCHSHHPDQARYCAEAYA